MLRTSRVVVLAVALVVAVPGLTHAADTCFTWGSSEIVAKAFVKPARGTCRDLFGFFSTNPDFFVNGMVCTSSDGDTLRMHWTHGGGSSNQLFATIVRAELPLPSMTGGTARMLSFTTSGNSFGSLTFSGALCDPRIVPIP